jgi:phosphinothricin acetyltransferase
METTIYICPTAQGMGVGSALYQHLIDHARVQKVHSLVACLYNGNIVSMKLHEKFGFRHVGDFKEVGWKFDAWQDVAYFQLMLCVDEH